MYQAQTWHDSSAMDTPISAARLGHMESGIADVDTRLASVETAAIVSVKSYGALGNGIRLYGAVSSTGSTTVTVSGANFTNLDIGKIAVVYTDSAAGAITTISAVVSATQITLTANAGITATSSTGYLIYGNDDAAAIQAALNAASAYVQTANATDANQPIGMGRSVVFLPASSPAGIYLIASALTIPSGVEFNGIATLANVLASRNAYCVQVSAYAVVRRLEIENLFGTGVLCGTASNQAHIYIGDIRVWHSTGSGTAPSGLSGSTSTTGGTLSANTRYYVVTAIDASGGETSVSNEVSVTSTGSTSSNTLNWTAFTGAVSYRIYRGTASGAQNLYFTSVTTSYLDTGTGSSNGYPVPPGIALRLQGYHHEICTAFLKIANIGVYHNPGSDCTVGSCYAVGCVTGVRLNASNQVRYGTLLLDTCGGTGSRGGLVLDNGCSNISAVVQAFQVAGVSTALTPVVNIGPLTSTAKCVDVRIQSQAASTGGTGLAIANASDITVDQLLTNTAFPSSGGGNITTGVAYGSGLTGEITVRSMLSASVTNPSTGTRVGTHLYQQGSTWTTDGPASFLPSVFLANQASPPGTPTGGGYLYVEAGALKYKGSSGTVTVIAPA